MGPIVIFLDALCIEKVIDDKFVVLDKPRTFDYVNIELNGEKKTAKITYFENQKQINDLSIHYTPKFNSNQTFILVDSAKKHKFPDSITSPKHTFDPVGCNMEVFEEALDPHYRFKKKAPKIGNTPLPPNFDSIPEFAFSTPPDPEHVVRDEQPLQASVEPAQNKTKRQKFWEWLRKWKPRFSFRKRPKPELSVHTPQRTKMGGTRYQRLARRSRKRKAN
jgi:hypothetical protein